MEIIRGIYVARLLLPLIIPNGYFLRLCTKFIFNFFPKP